MVFALNAHFTSFSILPVSSFCATHTHTHTHTPAHRHVSQPVSTFNRAHVHTNIFSVQECFIFRSSPAMQCHAMPFQNSVIKFASCQCVIWFGFSRLSKIKCDKIIWAQENLHGNSHVICSTSCRIYLERVSLTAFSIYCILLIFSLVAHFSRTLYAYGCFH